MSNNFIPSLQTLPVELLYRIFDRLDAQTILFTLRCTCRRLKAVVNTYDRFILDFKSISKPDFHLLCHLIDPRKVTSLRLSHDDETLEQIELFLSLFGFQQFTRLRSLTLLGIEEHQLKLILKCLNSRSLNSFNLQIGKCDDRRKTTTAKLLSTIFAQAKLLKLELDFAPGRFEKIIWPAHYPIQHLRINSMIAFDHIFTVFRSLPHLQTLVIKSFSVPNIHEIDSMHPLRTSCLHLTSLTFDNLYAEIEDLEIFLLLMPSLTHLKLIGNGKFLDGKRWEQFLKTNLPLLNKFEFFFTQWSNLSQNRADIESIIALFRTPFWLEDKKWFVTCEYNVDSSETIKLYSIPVCVSSLKYESESKRKSLSTFLPANGDQTSIMDNIKAIRLNFGTLKTSGIEQKLTMNNESTSQPLFRKVEKLDLEFDADQPSGWTSFVSTLIDLTTIVQIKFTGILIRKSDPVMLADIGSLLRQTTNLSSLDLCFGFFTRKSSLTADDIYFLIPNHVEHLAVSIKNLDEVELILERFEHLSSVHFFFDYTPSSSRISKWLAQKKKNSTCRIDGFSACVWLAKSSSTPRNGRANNKRIKLIDEHHDT